ncbi:PREDICTED: uncharacterized protein LOC108374769, partial [Rhagoletis zephyria]|uniref:uncharacterized protein LOC108374769 n=1 Tax=Rhagoletis zephyria TaxID=28612 RepID=UPI000811A763
MNSFNQKPLKYRLQKQLEIRLSLFIAERNLPLSALDHLNKCLKSVNDSKIIAKFTTNRIKGQTIINSVTGPHNCKLISDITNKQYYSVIIDESTDISLNKNLAIIIRVYRVKCQDRFLDFAPVNDSSAEGTFKALLKVLNGHNVPIKHMLGFTTDNCSGHVCHGLNLSSEAAAATLPTGIEKLVRDINKHFSHSPNRKGDFENFQTEFGTELHAIIEICPNTLAFEE